MSRRALLRLLVYSTPLACLGDALWVEPSWLRVKRLTLGESPSLRLPLFTDLHYKGDAAFLEKVVRKINALAPSFACFTGDIVENTKYLDRALDILAGIECPLYGVPGNHEHWCGASDNVIRDCFRSTGGDWLHDRSAMAADGRCRIDGKSGAYISTRGHALRNSMPGEHLAAAPAERDSLAAEMRILLTHHPAHANSLTNEKYDLILAGHSHGGQVRLPFVGALIVPYGVDGYEAGLYDTPAGPLHVSVGIGTFFLPIRFLCRPELVVIDM